MGAAVTVELAKPADASDILQTKDLHFARSEVIRLRKELGHLAKAHGLRVLVDDASDLVLGDDEEEDFERCVREVAHIRQCLRLNTQQSVRQQRTRNYQRSTSSGQFIPLREAGRLSEEKKYDSKYDDDDDKHKGDDDDDDSSDDDDNK